ncbi:MAG: 16S rRNA processing protein RimM [Paraprevotella sp.]|nr:16S rRNA processing protein RimM [Paraprevotella sp.]
MIRDEEVYKIGSITKTHGVCGELSMTFTDDVFDRVDAEYLICRIDGILVPFFMKEYRFKSDTTVLVTFEDIDTEEKARKMTGIDVYFPKALTDEITDGEYTWSYFTGFEVCDVTHGELGYVEYVNDQTMNVLFEIKTPAGDELLVPACEEFIVEIDQQNRKIFMQLPEGLLALDNDNP